MNLKAEEKAIELENLIDSIKELKEEYERRISSLNPKEEKNEYYSLLDANRQDVYMKVVGDLEELLK